VHPTEEGLALIHDQPTIVFGADVYHAPPGSNRPSFAALVASMDRQLATYHTLVCAQASRCEVIEAMEDLISQHLRRFHALNGVPPQRLIFYRDGVGVTQFNIIIAKELTAIRSACTKTGGAGYNPQLIFVVVQKRNHCRIFAHGNNQINNAHPGTVVDTDITTASQFDFYMCAHYGLKGTSRPTHYHVLCDDVGVHADQLQRFTFDLCHLFARCTKIVSSPAPTYYAHLAAYHAHYCMADFKEEEGSDAGSAYSGNTMTSNVCTVQPHMQDLLYYT